jgi:hypothetical protein
LIEDTIMTTTYTHILDLAKEAEPPADGILSRTVFQDERIKAVVFGVGQGQERPTTRRRSRPCCTS